jgi:hypothetical protein
VASSGKQWQAVASSGKQWQAVASSCEFPKKSNLTVENGLWVKSY